MAKSIKQVASIIVLGVFLILGVNSSLVGQSKTSSKIEELNVRENETYVSFNYNENLMPIIIDGKVASVVFDSEDFPGVERVVGHLSADVERVTGQFPKTYIGLPAEKISSAIIVGTIGHSDLIDDLVASGKLNVDELTGKREKFYITTIARPFKNIENAVVIIGSDKRGTIYGMFDLSEKIGVSPWYWWADVPVVKRNSIGIRPGLFTDGEPEVKYRGIFINDEAPALAGWVEENFGGFNVEFYQHVFELILRMKGNYLWPAMWGRAIYDDDLKSPELADEYGVVIGTSHHEPLMRAHVEWERYGKGDWNYATNPKELRKFWTEGIERMGNNESIISLGMRGDGDEPMSEESNIALLKKIVDDQRSIISDITNRPIEETPQLWALYKEVQDYYDRGMTVQDDVTLLLCDDNWGNIRKLPAPDAPERAGGYGIYYHYDYVGDPRNYKWINTNNISRTWEQMEMAYTHDANEIWIVNVGDIKPMELPIQFFMDMAWSPKQMSHDKMSMYTEQWASQQFNSFRSDEIADLLNKYTKFNARRKPELLNVPAYSVTQYNEAYRIVEEYKSLEKKAFRIFNELPQNYHDAYFQLVYYPISASANMNELYFAHNVNHWYAEQGRSEANAWADQVKLLYNKDSLLTEQYNHAVANGKWNHFMDQSHIGYTYWQQPPTNTMPAIKYLDIPQKGELGVWLPGYDNVLNSIENNVLPLLDSKVHTSTYIELFNTGEKPIEYTIKSNVKWVIVESDHGVCASQKRINISVDFSVIRDSAQAELVINANGKDQSIFLRAEQSRIPVDYVGYVEHHGVISIKPEQGFVPIDGSDLSWQVIDRIGRTGDGMKAFPSNISVKPETLNETSPHLSYGIFIDEADSFDIDLMISPTIDFYNKGGLLTGVSIDGGMVQVMNVHENTGTYDWGQSVSDNVNIVSAKIEIGEGKHVINIWHLDPGIVLEKILIKREGVNDETYLGPPSTYMNGTE